MQIPRLESLLTIFGGGFLLMVLVDAFYFNPEVFAELWPVILPLVAGLLTLMMPFPSLHAGLDAWVAEDAEPLPKPEERTFSYSFVMLRVWLVNGMRWIWNVTRGLRIPALRSGLRVTLLPYLLMITAGLFICSLAVSVLGWDRPQVYRPAGGKRGRRRSPFQHHRPAPSFDADDGDDWVEEPDARVSYGAKALPERLIAVCYQQPGFVEVRDDRGGLLFQVTGAELLGYTARSVTVRMGDFVQTMDQRGRIVMNRVGVDTAHPA